MVFRKLLYKMTCALLLYTILCPWQVLGDEKKVLTLKDSVDIALEKNWNVKAQQEKLNQAEYVKNKARAVNSSLS